MRCYTKSTSSLFLLKSCQFIFYWMQCNECCCLIKYHTLDTSPFGHHTFIPSLRFLIHNSIFMEISIPNTCFTVEHYKASRLFCGQAIQWHTGDFSVSFTIILQMLSTLQALKQKQDSNFVQPLQQANSTEGVVLNIHSHLHLLCVCVYMCFVSSTKRQSLALYCTTCCWRMIKKWTLYPWD